MCVCIWWCVYIFIYIYKYIDIYIFIYVCIYLCTYVFVCVCKCIYMYAYTVKQSLWDIIYKKLHLQMLLLRRPTNLTVYIDTSLDFT